MFILYRSKAAPSCIHKAKRPQALYIMDIRCGFARQGGLTFVGAASWMLRCWSEFLLPGMTSTKLFRRSGEDVNRSLHTLTTVGSELLILNQTVSFHHLSLVDPLTMLYYQHLTTDPMHHHFVSLCMADNNCKCLVCRA